MIDFSYRFLSRNEAYLIGTWKIWDRFFVSIFLMNQLSLLDRNRYEKLISKAGLENINFKGIKLMNLPFSYQIISFDRKVDDLSIWYLWNRYFLNPVLRWIFRIDLCLEMRIEYLIGKNRYLVNLLLMNNFS